MNIFFNHQINFWLNHQSNEQSLFKNHQSHWTKFCLFFTTKVSDKGCLFTQKPTNRDSLNHQSQWTKRFFSTTKAHEKKFTAKAKEQSFSPPKPKNKVFHHQIFSGTQRRFVCWLLIVPATCECISGTDLHRQFYVLPHWDRSCRSSFPSHPVTVYWHRADQSQCWPYNARRLAG